MENLFKNHPIFHQKHVMVAVALAMVFLAVAYSADLSETDERNLAESEDGALSIDEG